MAVSVSAEVASAPASAVDALVRLRALVVTDLSSALCAHAHPKSSAVSGGGAAVWRTRVRFYGVPEEQVG